MPKANRVLIVDNKLYTIGKDVDVIAIETGRDGIKRGSRIENAMTRDKMMEILTNVRWAHDA